MKKYLFLNAINIGLISQFYKIVNLDHIRDRILEIYNIFYPINI